MLINILKLANPKFNFFSVVCLSHNLDDFNMDFEFVFEILNMNTRPKNLFLGFPSEIESTQIDTKIEIENRGKHLNFQKNEFLYHHKI
ncbi:hypothetical protein BpHYR1_021568 [Brachionus plicatilis]|uniref:Uncharacterized protein n=1 Tax=Brachionus plicatilis TaxID=10195 RepID=A0A3M7S711_BRAPC|nr:hypothetical protein BpHYR1_021568 [Brachionus plicatilis]